MRSLYDGRVIFIQFLKPIRVITPAPTATRTYAQRSSRMKRKGGLSSELSAAKRQSEPEPDYCDASLQLDEDGAPIWPAPVEAMEVARRFLRQWLDVSGSCDSARLLTLVRKRCFFSQDTDCSGQRCRWPGCRCHYPQNSYCVGSSTIAHRCALNQERSHDPY